MNQASVIVPSSPLYPPTITPPEVPLPLYRFAWRFLGNPLLAIPQQVYQDRFVVLRNPGAPTIAWITAPDLTERVLQNKDNLFVKTPLEKRVFKRSIREGVLTSDGPEWRWQRRVMAPLFRHSELGGYVPAMAEAAAELTSRWRRDGARKRAIDQDMADVTFSVIARTMLAGGEPDESETIKQCGERYLSRIPWEMLWELLGLPEWLPHPAVLALNRASTQMRSAVRAIINRHRRSGVSDAQDLLGQLLNARDPETDRPMPDDLLIDNLLTLLMAGHETTAKALTWSLYLLARAPHWQNQIRDEVMQVVGNSSISYEQISQLPITERVLKEAMRLYPPAPVMARTPVREFDLEGYDIPAGSQVVIPLFCVHRHRKLWDDPDLFDPDRFLPERAADIPRAQYMPFGVGPRTCIGMSFAIMEAIVLLATFVRDAEFDWDRVHMPEPISRVTLRPKGGMPLQVLPL